MYTIYKFLMTYKYVRYINLLQKLHSGASLLQYIPLSDDKHHFVHWKSETTSETKIFPDNFFSDKNFFSQILSRTEFFLGLHTAVAFRMQSFNFVES